MASKSAKGKTLKFPRTVRGSLESKFYARFGREPNNTLELDQFASTLSQEERSDATSARSERTSVVNQVLDHNLRERSYMENRAANREEIMMQRDRKFLRGMIRQWKKEQPHSINTLDRGQEWLPGNIIPNQDRNIRFRTKQEAIDFTQANKPHRPGALVPGSELEGVISSMVNAERKARDERAASDASSLVNAASKAGDAKSGPLYNYQFKKRAGEGVDAMLKRLEDEVNQAADLQFAEARAARAQRSADIKKRAEGRQLAAEVNESIDEMFRKKKIVSPPSAATPTTVKAPTVPFPFNPSASLPPGDSQTASSVVKFTLTNDFGVSPSTVHRAGSIMRGDFINKTNVSANQGSVAHRSAGLWTPQPLKKSTGRPGRIRASAKDDFSLTFPTPPSIGDGNKASIVHRSAGLWTSLDRIKKSGGRHK